MMRQPLPMIAWFLAGAVALSSFGIGLAHAASKIGVTAAVKNDVEGIQGGSSRALAIGSSVFERERIRTGIQSVAQLLFLDQTTLSVGPRSEVTLDRFVYDPARNSGDVLLSATKGAFRFISGAQNPLNYRVSTPVAVIGFRGSIVSCSVGSLTCTVEQGIVTLQLNGTLITVNAGETVTINDDGSVIGPYAFDGAAREIASGVPWPLYPGALETEAWEVEIPDDSTIRLEDLFDEEIIIDDCPKGECEYPQ